MQNKKFFIAPIKAYQYVSKMFPASCRYYPSCSEYAKWQFEFNTPHRAMVQSALRIARCNQLFAGGIDYPLVKYLPPISIDLPYFNNSCVKIKVIYWFVPKQGTDLYYVVKDFNAIHSHLTNTP